MKLVTGMDEVGRAAGGLKIIPFRIASRLALYDEYVVEGVCSTAFSQCDWVLC